MGADGARYSHCPIHVRHRSSAVSVCDGSRHVRSPRGRQLEPDVLRLRIREHWHGDGTLAGRRRTAAVRELRRYRDGDPHGRFRYPHVTLCETQTRQALTTLDVVRGDPNGVDALALTQAEPLIETIKRVRVEIPFRAIG